METGTENADHSGSHELVSLAVKLADQMGHSGNVILERISGGRNNQVFKMTVDDQRFLLKSYFVHEDDPRDRLGNEFSFLRYAWDKGIRCIPQPFAADENQHVAVYEFVEGKRLKESDVNSDFVAQAMRFILELNQYKKTDEGMKLPFASEACFSIGEHLDCVEKRLRRLCEIAPCDSLSKYAYDFIQGQLIPCCLTMRNNILEKFENSYGLINEVISNDERCLSPSDFGFHNALLEKNGKLRFIDFEYAGWDDPAKMVCDFFCQPEVPVPLDYFPAFQDCITASVGEQENLRERIRLLMPVHRIKWCCIMLNEFIPEGYARRSYAAKDVEIRRKEERIDKVKAYLAATLNCN